MIAPREHGEEYVLKWYTKKVTWKKQEITVQFVFCQHCTIFSQHFCTTGFTQDLTVNSQQTRKGFDVHIKHWII